MIKEKHNIDNVEVEVFIHPDGFSYEEKGKTILVEKCAGYKFKLNGNEYGSHFPYNETEDITELSLIKAKEAIKNLKV